METWLSVTARLIIVSAEGITANQTIVSILNVVEEADG
jgi:hypothetical protein